MTSNGPQPSTPPNGASQTSDPHNDAEQLDGNALGERPPNDHRAEHGLPGVNEFTGREPMHSEDPALLMGGSETRDEIHTREWRERPDDLASAADAEIRLREARAINCPSDEGPGTLDSEDQALADAFAPQDGELSAEEAALHLEPER